MDKNRAILQVSGADAVHFLQGLLTQDINRLASETIQFAALLSPQGKILHDMFVLDATALGSAGIFLDIPESQKGTLLKRLMLYKLRAAVTLTDVSAQWSVIYAPTGGMLDPRHPSLPHRHYVPAAMDASVIPAILTTEEYHAQRLALGIPDSTSDFAPDEIVALDAGYDLLHAVSFTKGCYVGQEITARMHYKQIARRGFYLLTHPEYPTRLALLKFDEVGAKEGSITRDGIAYHAQLPAWMAPKFAQYAAPVEAK